MEQNRLPFNRQQEILVTLAMYAVGVDNLQSIIHRALQQLCLGMNVDYAVMLKWKQQQNTLLLIDHAGWSMPGSKETEIKADQRWDAGYALQAEKPVVITDFSWEKRFKLQPPLRGLNITSGIIVKIIESDEVCGILAVYTDKSQKFTSEEINFLQLTANLIGMASERIKVTECLKEANLRLKAEIERNKKFQKEILQNSVVERWNIGGYLHDNIAQLLVSVKMMVSSIQHKLEGSHIDLTVELKEILGKLDEGVKGVRELTHDIIPVDVEAEGVSQAFKLLIRQLQKTHDINCRLKSGTVIEQIKDRKLATNLYHVIQEAIKNAAVHGKADNAEVLIEKEGSKLILQITDDGKGLSQASRGSGDQRVSSGINIMQHRIELLGGEFTIEEISGKGQTGTRITCIVPLDA